MVSSQTGDVATSFVCELASEVQACRSTDLDQEAMEDGFVFSWQEFSRIVASGGEFEEVLGIVCVSRVFDFAAGRDASV